MTGHHHHGDPFGNPHDLARYLRKLQGADRARWQKPDRVVASLKLRRTDIVADVGAGPGYFSMRLAKRAAHVWALEAQPEIFEVLAKRTAKLAHLAPVRVTAGEPKLAPSSVDLILIVNTYHHLSGATYLRKLRRALRPRGRIAVVDFHPEAPMGPHHKVSREELLADARRAGLKRIREHTFLEHQYFIELAAR